jgi:hypothetical protein
VFSAAQLKKEFFPQYVTRNFAFGVYRSGELGFGPWDWDGIGSGTHSVSLEDPGSSLG